MLKFRFWGFRHFLRNQKSLPCCRVMFSRSRPVFAYFAKCIGNPIVKKMAPKNVDFPFFEPPDAPIFTKIGPNLAYIKLYIADYRIFDILCFWVFWGPERAKFWQILKKRLKLALSGPQKKQKPLLS